MAIAVRAVATPVGTTGATTIVITKPSGTAQNDLLYAGISFRGGTDVGTLTPPTDWVLVRRTNNGTSIGLSVFRKVAGASEPSDYTWTFNSSVKASGCIIAFSGVDTAAIVNAENGQTTSSGTSHATPDINTTVANTMLVGTFAVATGTDWTISSMTEQFDISSSGGSASTRNATLGATETRTATGATGTRTATSGAAAAGVTHLMALTPKGVTSMAAAISGSVVVAAGMLKKLALAAAIAGSADATANIKPVRGLTAAITASADASSNLSICSCLYANISASADAAASLTKTVPVAAGISGSADASATLSKKTLLTAALSGNGDAVAALSQTYSISGAISASGDASATLANKKSMTASISVGADAAAALWNLAQVTVENTYSAKGTITLTNKLVIPNVTIGERSGRMLVVLVGLNQEDTSGGTSGEVAGATWGGQSLSLKIENTSLTPYYLRTYWMYLSSPSSGTADVEITFSEQAEGYSIAAAGAALSLYHVDNTTPFSGITSPEANEGNVVLNVSSGRSKGLSIDSSVARYLHSMTCSQTQLSRNVQSGQDGDSGTVIHGTSSKTGVGTVMMTWLDGTGTYHEWSAVGVNTLPGDKPTYMAGGVSVNAGATAGLSKKINMGASASASGDASAAVSAKRGLSSGSSASADVAATLKTAGETKYLEASATSSGDASAQLSKTVPLGAGLSASGDSTASLAFRRFLSGAISGSAGVAGAINKAAPLNAAISASGDASAAMRADFSMAAVSLASADASALLAVLKHVSAATSASGDVSASLMRRVFMAGETSSSGDMAAGMLRKIGLFGNATASGDVTASMIYLASLQGYVLGSGDVTASMNAEKTYSAAISASGDASALLIQKLIDIHEQEVHVTSVSRQDVTIETAAERDIIIEGTNHSQIEV